MILFKNLKLKAKRIFIQIQIKYNISVLHFTNNSFVFHKVSITYFLFLLLLAIYLYINFTF